MSYSEVQDFDEKEAALANMLSCIADHLPDQLSALALEVGGSGGILAALLSSHVSHVYSTDIEDVGKKYGGEFSKLLKEKFLRNGRDFDISRVEFMKMDAQNIFFRDNFANLIFSHNVFEHIPDPIAALRECIRVAAPGGLIYLSFDPVWTADSGSHFFHYIGIPWQHLISDDEEIELLMRSNGASDFEVQSYKCDMNRLPSTYYRDHFPEVIAESRAELLYSSSYSGCVEESFHEHPNRELAARKLNCTQDDLLIRNFQFLIRKI